MRTINKRRDWKTLARVMWGIAGAASTSACATQFNARAASDYFGHPSRVLIAGSYHPGMERGPMQHFQDTLVQSVEACGINVVQNAASSDLALAGANPQKNPDAELTYRTLSYAHTSGLYVKSEMFEALFVELPSRRIVWRGTFGIENGFLDYTTGRIARDLVGRLAADGILKTCGQIS